VKIVSAFAARRPWAAVLVCLTGGPVVGMLYLAKGRNAGVYFLLGLLLSAALFAAFCLGLTDLEPATMALWALALLHLAGMVHGYGIARDLHGHISRVWFSRWYAVAGLFILLQAGAPAVRYFLWEPFSIPSSPMFPTLAVGDHIWVSRFAYGVPLFSGNTASPERGDIVVYKRDDGTTFVRRIIGLPGDRIQYRRGRLYINDVPAERVPGGTDGDLTLYTETLPDGRRHAIAERSDTGPGDNTPLYEVPTGHYFGLGDNRDNSYDSRFKEVGYIPRERIVGRFSVVYWNKLTRRLTWETRP